MELARAAGDVRTAADDDAADGAKVRRRIAAGGLADVAGDGDVACSGGEREPAAADDEAGNGVDVFKVRGETVEDWQESIEGELVGAAAAAHGERARVHRGMEHMDFRRVDEDDVHPIDVRRSQAAAVVKADVCPAADRKDREQIARSVAGDIHVFTGEKVEHRRGRDAGFENLDAMRRSAHSGRNGIDALACCEGFQECLPAR